LLGGLILNLKYAGFEVLIAITMTTNSAIAIGISELGKACTRDNNPEANFIAKRTVPSCTHHAVPAVGWMTQEELSGQRVCVYESVWSAPVGTAH
jgi:hypothetical protein